MWDYSEKVKEHFYNPKNAGTLDDANGVGDVGSISCGDALRLSIKVDESTDTILDASFQTFGCGSAIASSSALTEIVKGKTLDEALEVTNQDIADYLDGLPPEKMHCSVMGREALQAAIANYRGEVWTDDHDEGALICKCYAIDDVMIRENIRANSLKTVEDVTNYTKAGGGCAACHEGIENILKEELAAIGESFDPVPIKRQKKVASAEPVVYQKKPAGTGLTLVQKIRRIEETIEMIRPTLKADGGDVELVDVEGNVIYVNLVGACTNCQLAAVTMGGIQQKLIEALGEFVKVVPASEREQLISVAGA